MRYEVHITVERFPTIDQVVRFQHWCVQNGAKPLFIELSRGTGTKLQLMSAFAYPIQIGDDPHAPMDSVALNWANGLADKIREAGFHVIRIKVESELCAGPAEYYEAHWKFKPEYRARFTDRDPRLNWLLASWNIMNGAAYLSRRFDWIGQSWQTVHEGFEQSGEYLKQMGYVFDKVHYERVVYDSAKELDAGWGGA